jgi:negative regulator of flagellin synthesis FlgM
MQVDTPGIGTRRPDVSSKINGIDARSAPLGAGRAVERSRDATTGTQTSADGSGGVHITGTARQLADLEQVVKDMPAIDEARVSAVSTALEQGTYRVAPERVAAGLLQLEHALQPIYGSKK